MKKHKQFIIWFVATFMLAFFIDCLVTIEIDRINYQTTQGAINQELSRLTSSVTSLLGSYEYGLRGTRGVIIAVGDSNITRERFLNYIQSRDLKKEFPGARGFGFVKKIAQDQEADFLAKARLDGKPDFNIRQLSPHQGDRYIIKYIEPLERNAAALGLDLASEIIRREAAESSMRSGKATLTGPITLVQAAANPLQSFLIFLPIYEGGKTPETISERERKIIGWSYAPLLMQEVLANLSLNDKTTNLILRDITRGSTGEIFFTSHKNGLAPTMSQTIEQEVMGRRWQIELGVYPSFIENLHLLHTKVVFFAGLIFSILLASLVGVLGLSQHRKRLITIEKARIAAIVENSIDGIISKDLNGVVTSWNLGAETIFGYSAQEAIGRSLAKLIVPENLQHEEISILASIAKGKAVPHFNTTRRRKDGSAVPVSVAVAPVRNSDGVIIGASKTVRDITEQKVIQDRILELNLNLEAKVFQRTEQLELASRSLQTVLDAVPSMIGYWDKHLINKVANRAYNAWFGLNHKTIPGMHARELLGQKLYEVNLPLMQAALNGEQQTFTRSIPTPSGLRHSLAHYLPDFENGEVQGFYVIVHDITDVTEANNNLQNALRENQALLTTINKQMLYSVTDIHGNIIEANSNFCKTCGYSREELIGKNHRILNSGHHSDEFWHELWRKIASGKPWHGEICNLSKSGDICWFDTVIAPFIGANGNVERYIALRSDITERKKTEEERARLSLFVNNVLNAASEVSIIATDVEGVVTIFNRGAELMLGYRADEIIGKTSPAIFHLQEEVINRGQTLSNEYGTHIEGFRTFVHKPEIYGSETRVWTYVRKDGAHLQVSLAVTAMRDSDGNILGYLGVGMDVTAELKSKRELKSTLDQLDIAANIAELGIWTWDLHDNSLIWSDRMFEMYAQPLTLRNNGLNYQHWYERIHPDDAINVAASLTAALEGRGVYDPTFRIVTPDGQIHFIQAGAQIEYDPAGKPAKVTGINKDVTVQKELEATLIKAKEHSEAASAAKSAFLANMSHEIRTPMNAVLGMLQLVQQTELTVRQQDYILKCQTAAKSLLGLLNDILDFSKIDSGKLQLDNHPFELEPLMRDLAIILSATQGEKDVEIIFDLDPSLPKSLLGDRLRLQQILINLTGNAFKFTNQGQVLVKLQMLEKYENEIRIRISVSDTGIGISAEQLEKIFEGFVQAEASTTRRFGGTGLGLAISKRLVNLMGGELQVESKKGLGSRFWFDINLKTNISKAEPLQTIQRPLAGLKILMVDDNINSREVFVRMLTHLGATTDEADDGLTAVKQVRNAFATNNPYDVILMDWHMPILDGLSAARLIHNIPSNHSPTIIMITAFEREENTHHISQEMKPYSMMLNKPVTASQLSESIIQAITKPKLNPQQIVHPEIKKQSLSGVHLLIVEDNEFNRQVASELLLAEGATVDLAEGGLEGVDKVLNGSTQFDLVIMDMQMPDIDGLEATRRIRAVERFKGLPILAMTANASATDREICLAAGMNDHLGKPINMDEVVPRILMLVGKQSIAKSEVSLTVNQKSTSELIDDMSIISKRYGGNIDLCINLFGRFHPDISKLLNTIMLQNQQQNTSAVAAALHSIKGVAGTMGAKALASRAAELEKELKLAISMTEIKMLTEETINELKNLLDECNSQLQNQFDNSKNLQS